MKVVLHDGLTVNWQTRFHDLEEEIHLCNKIRGKFCCRHKRMFLYDLCLSTLHRICKQVNKLMQVPLSPSKQAINILPLC
jgi:hypothetical protein